GGYAPLAEALAQKGRALVVLGEAKERIIEAVGSKLTIERADSMPEAVERAFALAETGDAVLLSPACSRLDMYQNYMERGESFIAAVERIRKRYQSGGGR